LPDALKLALANRPEVRQFALQKEMNELDVKFFRNQTKPQVDLTASYKLIGVAGSVASFPDQNGVLQPDIAPSAFIGGYGATTLAVNHQGQFPATTISFNLAPGAAVEAIEKAKREIGLPAYIQAGFQGTAQAFQA
jgi:multidrug efflux pump subunit AcrB